MGKAHEPPPSLSIHAQCFWTFTPQERFVMNRALQDFLRDKTYPERHRRVALMLRDALTELSDQD